MNKPFHVLVLAAGFVSMLSGRASAQIFTTLHSAYGVNQAGLPGAGMVSSENILYGTVVNGGSSGSGIVFRLNNDGSGFAPLHTFSASALNIDGRYYTNSDGVGPTRLVVAGQTVFGAAVSGGRGGGGALFRMNTDGSGFYILRNFIARPSSPLANDGVGPGSLIVSGNTLYGTTQAGGVAGNGTLFAINVDGTGFRTLHSFTTTSQFFEVHGTNSDGAFPSGLVLTGNSLYGTAAYGGVLGNGTVFKINTDGTGFMPLHTFAANTGDLSGVLVNSDGAEPSAGLILSGNTLFGTAAYCGRFGQGTVFRVNTDGTDFATLYSFNRVPIPILDSPANTNSGGARPFGGLALAGDTIYGTTLIGGSLANGTLFALNTNGTSFTTLHNFSGFSTDSLGNYLNFSNQDGATPSGDLTLLGNTLYGTTSRGGLFGNGVVFGFSFLPQLAMARSEGNIVLSWPANYTGFDYAGFSLQTTTDLVSQVWTTASPGSVIVQGQNTITNLISGTQRFYRLSK